MIGYYVHHHGLGHLHRAASICARLRPPVTALTSLDIPSPYPFADVIALPRDDEARWATEPAAYGALHWAPQHDRGLTTRMALIARWIDRTRPACWAPLLEIDWQALGLPDGRATPHPWPDICAADVIVTHAGQGCVADVAAAERPAIVLPQSRPFGEQYVTGEALRRHRRAVVIRSWPDSSGWRDLIMHARSTNPTRWRNCQTESAAARAAHSIEAAPGRCATDGAP